MATGSVSRPASRPTRSVRHRCVTPPAHRPEVTREAGEISGARPRPADRQRREGANPSGRFERLQTATYIPQRLGGCWSQSAEGPPSSLSVGHSPTVSTPIPDGAAPTTSHWHAPGRHGREPGQRDYPLSFGSRRSPRRGDHPKRQSPSDCHCRLDTLPTEPIRWMTSPRELSCGRSTPSILPESQVVCWVDATSTASRCCAVTGTHPWSPPLPSSRNPERVQSVQEGAPLPNE